MIAAVAWLVAETAHTLARRASDPPAKSDIPYARAEHRAKATTMPPSVTATSAAR
jgi:hypothetical protein